MKFSRNEKILLASLIIALAASSAMLITSAFYPGSHSLYLNRTTNLTQPTMAAEFCMKCHVEKTQNVSLSVHRNAGCICHGYNPNFTAEYNINLAHNLTKNIYCTNCHSGYNVTTGNIDIHSGVSGLNQSAHYILSAGDRAGAYLRAKNFFANNTQG